MPDPQLITQPVDHDPYGFDFQPVDHNPFASMTHQPEGQNPAQPYLDAATQFSRTALGFATGGLQGAGVPMPDWMRSNPIQSALQNPDNAAVLGMGRAAFWDNPALVAKANDMIAAGHGRQAIADELGVGKASVGRYLDRTGQKTAAAENPDFWKANPESEDVLRAEVNKGTPFAKIANRLGLSPGTVYERFEKLRNAGEFPDYARQSAQSKALLADPVKRADLIRLAKEGEYSLSDMATYFYGGSKSQHGGHPRKGDISRYIKQLQGEGTPEEQEALRNYAPQGIRGLQGGGGGGAGLTPAGRTPTLPQTRFMQNEAPQDDPEMTKAIIQYLRSLGLHASLFQGNALG